MSQGFGKLERTDADRIAEHRCLPLAQKYLERLEGHFPRRKFKLAMRQLTLTIQCVDAYTNIRFHGERSVMVCMGEYQAKVTQQVVFDVLAKAFENETKLRKKQSHQRQQINNWVQRLQTTEMLDTPQLVLSVTPSTDEPKSAPAAIWHWVGLPDDPVIEVRFMCYRNVWAGHDNFRVYFGDRQHTFNQISEVESFFNGNDVFKELDKSVGKENFQFITPTATEAEMTWPKVEGPYVIVPRARLVQSTPHLLLMQAHNPEILQARVKPTVWYAQERVQAAMQSFQLGAKTVDFVKFPCHPELQWDFHYAGQELEPEFGDDEDDDI